MKLISKAFLCGIGMATMLAALLAGSLAAQTTEPVAGPEVRAMVTVVRRNAKAPQTLVADDVLVYQNHDRRPVVSWMPVQRPGAQSDFAILVDDSAGASFGNQIGDLKKFILSLPATTRVATVYAVHGDASILQDFTTDHEVAAKALRLPVGRSNEGSSIYMALGDLIKRMPQDGHPQGILLISDGIDLYRGVADSQPGLNPDLSTALDQAQRRGVTIYTLFANSAGWNRQNQFLINNGQSCLSMLTFATGGQSFFEGFETPVSFAPFLQQLSKLLSEQYVLTFRATPVEKPGLEAVRITTEQPAIQLLAPQSVYVPGP